MAESFAIIENVLDPTEIQYFKGWAMNPDHPHRGNAKDGQYYDTHDGKREYNVWWTIQPPLDSWVDIVQRMKYEINAIMQTKEWTIHAVDCITTAPGAQKIYAHIDFPHKFKEAQELDGVLGAQIIIPLDAFTRENGGTMFMPFVDENITTTDIQENQSKYNDILVRDGIQLIANAGDALIYNSKTLHSTMSNNSDAYRSALLINVLRNDCVDFVAEQDINTDKNTRNHYRNV